MKKYFIFAFLLSVFLLSGCCCIPLDNIIPRPPQELCGNSVVDADENCSSCPADVRCAEGEECVDGVCEEIELCGNGSIDEGENCSNCPSDVSCPSGQECINDVCQDSSPPGLCGNGSVDSGENCSNCPADVRCAEEEECIDGLCVEVIDLCGNGEIDEGEDCDNCQQDVRCEDDEECVDGECVEGGEPSGNRALIRLNGVNQSLAVGEEIRVYGLFEYSGQRFDVVLASILQTGHLSYEAEFELQDSEGNVVSTSIVALDEELIFYDEEDVEIRIDATIYLANVFIS